jgi:hypothetical protein
MSRLSFSDTLRQAILADLHESCGRHPAENLYAFALVGDPTGDYLGYAVATEQGLLRVATEYERRGYRYQGYDVEQVRQSRAVEAVAPLGEP